MSVSELRTLSGSEDSWPSSFHGSSGSWSFDDIISLSGSISEPEPDSSSLESSDAGCAGFTGRLELAESVNPRTLFLSSNGSNLIPIPRPRCLPL